MSDIERPTRRHPDFRFFAADSAGVQLSDNGVKMVFAVEDLDGSMFEQAGVVLNLGLAKLVSLILADGISRYEERVGREIPLDPAKVDAIKAALDAANPATSPNDP